MKKTMLIILCLLAQGALLFASAGWEVPASQQPKYGLLDAGVPAEFQGNWKAIQYRDDANPQEYWTISAFNIAMRDYETSQQKWVYNDQKFITVTQLEAKKQYKCLLLTEPSSTITLPGNLYNQWEAWADTIPSVLISYFTSGQLTSLRNKLGYNLLTGKYSKRFLVLVCYSTKDLPNNEDDGAGDEYYKYAYADADGSTTGTTYATLSADVNYKLRPKASCYVVVRE
ncbi:MAG: hypothetical protein LBT68_07475 [Spirochaetales bacterium]|jgi:hypothetical protein|nr:hypothetical protein [Spirochaetales bacterium]